MQFKRHERLGYDDYCIVEFDKLSHMNHAVISNFYDKFHYIGGKSHNSSNVWTFPACVTSQIISEIIRNTCFMCGGLIKDAQALQNTLASFNDFGNDADSRGTTQSRVGPATIKNVRKCTQCGHSHT